MSEFTINCKGKLVELDTPKVMGILNITPNSFYDGGRYKSDSDFLKQAETMFVDGATFLDLGAYSSKPNAEFVSVEEEAQRLLPVLELLLKEFPDALISIDTFRADVAKKAINSGAAIINDISGGMLDSNMLQTVGELGVPYIMMHMRGTPNTMQQFTQYTNLINDILYYFSERISSARSYNIKDIIIDPGFGFSKTLDQNYELMQKMELFSILELPLLVGISRKSMIYKLLGTTPKEALNGTTVLNTISLQKGAKILRVHDVKEAVETLQILNKIL
ncbi:dihydropteroate synthase [Myroides guanonis]|uniref:Dihydropteroate synthase n=1 Tax=Myroides guanonis TaxID=1150112 RepID=A0A1I3U293_9FLAO|nr:dihydropteroate synthase [Myroides guanonis]SFJ76006.1 dihydropteroate synthase [Myroides guanonis]